MTPHSPSDKRLLTTRRGVSLLIAGMIVAVMLAQVDWAAFWRILQELSPVHLVGAFAVYVLLNFFRSLRYITLLDRPLAIRRVFPIALYHNFLVRLLPFKLGEISYIVLMQKRLNVPVKAGVSSLFSSRLLELLVIVLVAAVSLLGSGDVLVLPYQGAIAGVLVAGCLVGGVVGFYYMGAILRTIARLLRRLFAVSLLLSIADKLEGLAQDFDRLHHPRIFAWALFWSLFTYSCSFGVNWILLMAIGIQPDLSTLVVLVSLGMFATAFPFNISGFGVVELSWGFGLTVLLGLTMGEATSIGLMLNGYQLLCAALSGTVGYVVVQWQAHESKWDDDI